MSKPCHFSFKIRIKQVFTINKRNIMKKPKYQQYCHFFCWLHTNSTCILVQLRVKYGNCSNERRIFRWQALIRGKRLFQCGYPKVSSLLEGALIWGLVLIRGYTVCFAMIDRIVTKRTEWSAFWFKVDEI